MKSIKFFVTFFAVFILLCSYITKFSYADDYIFQNGFEEGVGNWKTNNTNVVFNLSSDPVFDGTQSASISNNSSSSFGIEQVVAGIQENTDYLINGRIKINEPPPSKAFIRIAWYGSADGSGSQMKTDDSELIASITDWKLLSFVAKSPAGAHSAKIRLLVSVGTVYFDNISITLNIPTPTVQPTPTTELTEPTDNNIQPTDPTSISNIYITEVMVYPETGQTEWIELYNNNSFEVTLTDWYIDDIENAGSSPKKFTMTLGPNGYNILDISSGIFNNDSDSARLLDSEENEKDSISYTSSQKNYSLGKATFANDVVCLQIPSKNATNNSCTTIVSTTTTVANSPTKKPVTPTLKKTPSPTPGIKKLLPTLKVKKQPTTYNLKLTTDHQPPTTAKVLGATTEIILNDESPTSIINTLTILAFSYSILSIISIISKLTFNKRILAP